MDRITALLGPAGTREGLRKLGGLLIGLALYVTFIRKSDPSLGSPWGDFGLFAVLALPAAFLYGVGFAGARAGGGPRAWHGVFLVFGILFVPGALSRFVTLINGDSGAALNVAWIFLVTAGLAVLAAFVAGVRYLLLIASIALTVSWLALWDKILSNGLTGDYGTFRGLSILMAAILVAGAVVVYLLHTERGAFGARREPPDPQRGLIEASDVVTGAGIAAIFGAGVISLTAFLSGVSASLAPLGGGFSTAGDSAFWDTVLLVISLALILYGGRFGVRGPTYVGAIGLLLFALVVGSDLDASTPEGKIVGWPLILFVVGVLAFLASFSQAGEALQRLRSSGASATPQGPPPEPPPAE